MGNLMTGYPTRRRQPFSVEQDLLPEETIARRDGLRRHHTPQ